MKRQRSFASRRRPANLLGPSILEQLESRLVFSVTIPASAQVAPGFAPGDMVADPVRNEVYLLDKTNNKVIEIDTDLGRKVGQANITDIPTALAISPDDRELYVSSKLGNTIQVFSLPDLSLVRTLDIAQPNRVAVSASHQLFVTGVNQNSPIRQVDSGSGAVLASFGSYYDALPTINAAGTKLYLSELGLSATGTDEFDISNPAVTPKKTTSYGTSMANGKDLEIDEKYNRLYAMSGGVYGVYMVDRATKAGTTWSFGGGTAYGSSVDVSEGLDFFYATSPDPYNGGIFKVDRVSGTMLQRYIPVGTYKEVEDVALTPNGNAIYISNPNSGALQIGIIGPAALTIGSIPNASFTAQVAAAPSRLATFDGTGSSDYESNGFIGSYAWNFGDGATGVGATATHTYAADGDYAVKLTVVDGQGNSDEFVKTLHISAAPTATGAVATTQEEKAVTIALQASDPDGDPLTYTVATPAAHGKVLISGNSAVYIPNRDYFGDDSFVFAASDGGRVATATVNIRINNVSDAPVAKDDAVALSASGPTIVNVLANDVDPDGDALGITFTQPANGAVQLSGNQLLYTPAAGFSGADSFKYTISDGTSNSTATVYLSPSAATVAGDWPTFGDSVAHTGYIAGTIGLGQPALSWSLPSGTSSNGNPIAIADGKVFIGSAITERVTMSAYDQASGRLLWSHNFPAGSINAPTYFNGRIYFQRGNGSADSQLWALDANTGATVWSAPFDQQWEVYYAPAVDNVGAWIDGGHYGGMYGFNLQDGSKIKFISTLQQYDNWTPSILNGSVYAFVGGVFVKYDASGNAIWTNTKGFNNTGYTMNRTTALVGNQAYLAGNPDFYSVSLVTGQTLWTVPGTFSGTPAVQGNTVYVLQGSTVKSYDTATGNPIGTFTATSTLTAQPIVTDDALIVASDSATYVFDRATNALRYTIPFGGKISLADNQLFIVSTGGTVRAFNFASPLAANAGGTYHVNEGATVALHGAATSTTGASISAWEWDFDYDGQTFNVDATGKDVTFSAANIDGTGRRRVALRVRDAAGNVSPIAGTEVLIDDVAPTATFTATSAANVGDPITAQFSSPIDTPLDQAFGLRYSFDFNNDGDFTDPGDVADSSSATASFTFASAGDFVVHGRIADKDGGATDYRSTITVGGPPPVASAGGPYEVAEGGSVGLLGSATASGGGQITYEWDFNYDGTNFDVDATGAAAQFSAAGLDGPLTRTIALRASDFPGHSSIATATVSITNVAPTATPAAPASVTEGTTGVVVSLTGATDPSTADAAALLYSFDFNNDGTFDVVDSPSSSAIIPDSLIADGPRTVTVKAHVADKDGGATDYLMDIAVTDVAPTAVFAAGPAVAVTNASSVSFASTADMSAADTAAGFTYSYDFNNDGDFGDPGEIVGSTAASASYTFPAAGSYVVHGRIADKDGGASDYTTTVTVNPPTPPAATMRDIRAAADAYVQDGSSAGTNFGSKTELDVKKSSSVGSNREGYLRFALTGGAAASVVDAAHLRLFTRLNTAGSMQLDLYAVSNATWSESGINWNNRPASTGSIIASKTISSTTGAWIDFDVSNYVKQQRAAGATAVSFVLRGHASSTPYAIIISDEASTNRPDLQLTEHVAPAVLLSGTSASVAEGGSSSVLTARLSTQPAGPVTVSIARTAGDTDLTAPATLTFTPFNWNVAQPITLSAAEDVDALNGTATFALTADGGYGTVTLTATEIDNDIPKTLRPTADSYVRDGTSAGSNFGTSTSLQVRKSTTAGNSAWTLLKFDLSLLKSITSATLRLNGKLDSTANASVAAQIFTASSTSWSETGVTWNNKPTASGSSLGQMSVSGTTAKWYTIDLTSYLQAQKAAGKTSVSLLLMSPTASTSMAVFSSDEASANGPQLVVK